MVALGLTGCETVETEAKYPSANKREGNSDGDIYSKQKTIFGDGGFFSTANDKSADSGISVNSFLWRASLDTVSFMPIVQADPFGGTILTDWYSPEGVEDERFKTNVFILGRQLRSDGVRVRVFKQEYDGKTWHDVDVSDETARKLEDTILTRARQLRVNQLED